MHSVKIIDLFKTSIGDVAVMAFSEITPKVGMILKKESNIKWQITGVGRNRKLEADNKYKFYDAETIWDCIIKPLNHSELLKLNEVLEVEYD